MKKYTVDGWAVDFPGRWLTERDEVDGHWLFYPPDSTLTVHVTPFRLAREGIPVPAETARAVYRRSLGETGGSPWPWPLPTGLAGETFDSAVEEGGKTICRICMGFYGPGELLSVNIYGDTREECRQAMDHFKTLSRD